MAGALVVAFVVVVAIPVGFLISMGIVAAVLSVVLTRWAEHTHPDSPYIELNR